MSIGDRKVKSRRVIAGGLVFGNAVTVDINANTNNLVIDDLENTVLIRLNVTGNFSLTGIEPVNTDDAQEIKIFNVGAGNLSMKDNDAASLATNRFLLGADKTVQPDEGITLTYDPVTLRWRATGVNI